MRHEIQEVDPIQIPVGETHVHQKLPHSLPRHHQMMRYPVTCQGKGPDGRVGVLARKEGTSLIENVRYAGDRCYEAIRQSVFPPKGVERHLIGGEPVERLRQGYAAQGITPDREIIAYCNSASEASHVHFTLRYLLGYPRVRVYVGSWTEWAEREELPLELGEASQSGSGKGPAH